MEKYEHQWDRDTWSGFQKELSRRCGSGSGGSSGAVTSRSLATAEQLRFLQRAYGIWGAGDLGLDEAAAAALLAQLVDEAEVVAAARALTERKRICDRRLQPEWTTWQRGGPAPRWVSQMGAVVARAWPHRWVERTPSGRYRIASAQPVRTVTDQVAFPSCWYHLRQRLTADRGSRPASPGATRDQEAVIRELVPDAHVSLSLTITEANALIRQLMTEYEQYVRRDEMWLEVKAEQAIREERQRQRRREKEGWAPDAKVTKWPPSRWRAYLAQCLAKRNAQPQLGPTSPDVPATELQRKWLRGLTVPEEVVLALLEQEADAVLGRDRDERVAAVRARQRPRGPKASSAGASHSSAGNGARGVACAGLLNRLVVGSSPT